MMRSIVHLLLAGAALGVSASSNAGAPPGSSAPAAAAAAAAEPKGVVLDTSRVHLGPAEAGTDAYVAWPLGKSAAPAVIVIHEWWGMNSQIRDVARRFARQGYVAIVPDLYHGRVAGDAEGAHVLMRGLEDEQALADLDAAARWLRGQGRTAKSRFGVVGFCMGGRLSQLFALHDSTVAAAVIYYGRPVTDPGQLASLRAPLQGHFGAEDQGIPAERVEELRRALEAAGKRAEIFLYAGAGHAFLNEGRPSYHADAARQAWARTLAFFQQHLKR